MKETKYQYIRKSGEVTFENNDAATIYELMARDLIAKKLQRCTYIKSMRRVNNYDGTITITMYQANGDKAVYTVPW